MFFVLLMLVVELPPSADEIYVLRPVNLNEIDSGRVWMGYESGIPLRQALRMFEYLNPGEERGRKTKLYKLPNTETYLASIHGQQLVQLKVIDTSITELFRSPLLDWCWTVEPSFFIGDSSVIVIAQFGEEHFEGFLVLESRAGHLKQLDHCGFVPLDADQAYASPADFIRVRRSAGTYVLDFPVDVKLYPMSYAETHLRCPKGGRITFRYDGSRFVKTP